jgi:polygalacturonase
MVVIAKTAGGSTYLSGAIFLKKSIHLRVDKGATLKGSSDPRDYPIVDSRFEGIERPFMCGFINATSLDGVMLCGEGAIDGSGDEYAARTAVAPVPRLSRHEHSKPRPRPLSLPPSNSPVRRPYRTFSQRPDRC